jgi:hypothetical protein
MTGSSKPHRPSAHHHDGEDALDPVERAARAEALADAEAGPGDAESTQDFVDRIWTDHGHWPDVYFPEGLAGLCYKDGAPLPSNHPDHPRVRGAPRQADGSLASYWQCTPGELRDMGVDAPPPRRSRHDGWSTARIEQFLEELRATASISDACRAVDMSRSSAYKLYARADSGHIRKAWDAALKAATNVLVTTAFDRAVNGVQEQVWYQGKMVGFRERHDNRHLQFMLKARDPLNWAPLDDLQGWVRHRGLPEAAMPADTALAHVRKGEEAWGRQLPGEDGCAEETLLPPPDERARAAKDAPTQAPAANRQLGSGGLNSGVLDSGMLDSGGDRKEQD